MLEELELEEHLPVFEAMGYDTVEQIRLMTYQILKDLGVPSLAAFKISNHCVICRQSKPTPPQ